MNKKTIIIISLISTVFSLIYILLNYFGLLRYFAMYIYPIEGYIYNYKNLDKIHKENKVIITLITTNKQLSNITPLIKSLLDQTVRVDLISIILPHNNTYILPPELTKTVALYKCTEEKAKTGNLNCLLSTIAREGEAKTKLITLDAGFIYGKDFIEILLDTGDKNPDSIIYVNPENNKIDLGKGVLFNMEFFDKDFINISDDVHANEWINKYIQIKGIKKQKINYSENYKRFLNN